MLIGKVYGVRELGFYSRGEMTAQLPATLLNGIIGRVAFPVFSRIAGNPQRLKDTMRLVQSRIMLINAPMTFGLIAVADPAVRVVFGEKWVPSVPYLQILSLVGLLLPMQVLNLQVLIALGKSNLFFRLELIKRAFGVVVLLAVASFGVTALAYGMVVASIIAFLINSYYTKHFISYGPFDQMKDVASALGMASVMAAVVLGTRELLGELPASRSLSIEVAVGILTYLGLALLLRPNVIAQLIPLMSKTGPIGNEKRC